MDNVSQLSEHQPKLTVQGGSHDGAEINEYRFERRLAEQIASGERPLYDLPPAVWQTIMAQWLEHQR